MNNRAVGYYYPSNLGEGGGICLYDCYEAEAQIRDNNIIYNESWAVGAGIYAKDSWLSINNNNISYNIERSGVAGSTEDYHGMAILVYNNTINFNGLTGINMSEGCYPQIKNNLIAFNKIAHGISINTFIPAIIENNTVIGNGFEEDYPGSGIYLSYASAEIKNNIIALNKRYGVFSYTPFPNTIIDYNNVWGNIEGGYYGYESGANDISVNPYFKDPFNGDFTLSSLSPCIDAGNPETEIPQNGGDRIDIGALEYYQPFNGYLTFEGYPQGIQTGSVATWDVSLMNPTSEPQTIDAWIEYSGPSCGVAKRFINLTIPPGEWNETVEIPIPDYLPEGAYTVKGRVGIFGEEIWDSEVFYLEVLPGPKKFAIPQ